MERWSWKAMLVPVIAVLSFAGTVVTLATGIPEINKNPVGRVFLAILCVGSIIYLSYFIYMSLIRAYLRMLKCFEQIEALITQFSSMHANQAFSGQIDPDLINLIVATKRITSIPLKITDLHFLPNNSIHIEIDRGFDDGIRDGMQFKVFHSSQWIEIGICGCTVNLKRTTLIVPISPNCSIIQSEMRQENIEVRLIEPLDNSKVNQLLASLQCTLDRK